MRINELQNKSDVAIRLRSHLTESGRSQTSVAKSIGLSGSVVSTYLAGTYKGDMAGTEDKIRQYLELEESRKDRIISSGSIIETQALIHITQALNVASRDQDMIVVTGPSGAGKTTTLKLYAQQHAAVILIEADPGYTSMALFAELCDRLGIPAKGSLHDLLQRVVEKLSNSGRLIIIDEAEQLPYRALELIRRVHDKACVPVALVGMPRLKKNLQGDHNHYAQLWSRVGFHRNVDLLAPQDEDAFVRTRLGDVPTDVLDLLRKECRHNARVLIKLMKWCAELCKVNKCDLDALIVAKAAELVSVA